MILVSGEIQGFGANKEFHLESALASNMAQIKNPINSSETVIELTLNSSDKLTYNGLRTELSTNREYIVEGERWYRFSIYIPTSWGYESSQIVIWQLHTSQKTAALPPPALCCIEDKYMFLELRSHDGMIDGTVTKETVQFQRVSLGGFAKSEWIDFVVNVNWCSRQNGGKLLVYRNKSLVYGSKNSPNCYQSWLGQYPKVGIYAPGGMTATTRKILVKPILVGDEYSSLL